MSTQLKGIGKIRYGINWFEELVNILSGPLLAISAAVAIIDLFTDGKIHTTIAPLAIGWAICQGFGLDFQLLSLGYKARTTFNEGKRWHFAGILFIALLLGAVALQSGAIFAAQGTQGEGIARAIAQLGIDPTFLIYERATLAVLLIFIAGWNKHDTVIEAAPAPTPSISSETMHIILQKLEKLDYLEQHITGQMPAVVIEEKQQGLLQAPVEVDEAISTLETGTTNDKQVYQAPIGFPSKRDAVLTAADRHPGAPVEEIARIADCSVKTASKWLAERKEA